MIKNFPINWTRKFWTVPALFIIDMRCNISTNILFNKWSVKLERIAGAHFLQCCFTWNCISVDLINRDEEYLTCQMICNFWSDDVCLFLVIPTCFVLPEHWKPLSWFWFFNSTENFVWVYSVQYLVFFTPYSLYQTGFKLWIFTYAVLAFYLAQ